MADVDDVLKTLERLVVREGGPLFEGDIFSVLRSSRTVIHSFEFALADGAVDCTCELDNSASYAARLWDVISRGQGEQASSLGLFDVKSTVGGLPGSQRYCTTRLQQRRVAFYIGISASDPTFVEVIPNLFQDDQVLPHTPDSAHKDDDMEVRVNVSRCSRLPPSASGLLDQCGAPCRMPLAMLPQAMENMRRCLQSAGKIPYENPWTGVRFPKFIPKLTTNVEFLTSKSTTDHHTSFAKFQEIYQAVTFIKPGLLEMDLVGVQPRLGDYKFLIEQSDSLRQVFVQDKVDSKSRTVGDRLTSVAVARSRPRGHGKPADPGYYFTTLERFDFLCYHFHFYRKDGSPGRATQNVIYFIPECEIPDSFYTSLANEQSFDIEEFRPFRIVQEKDAECRWVEEMRAIIDRYPEPRKRGQRPTRPQEDIMETMVDEEEPTMIDDEEVLPEVRDGNTRAAKRKSGWSLYTKIFIRRHSAFWNNIMGRCATRGAGLLVVLSTNHPYGDFVYLPYAWSRREQEDFRRFRRPPQAGHHLPKESCVVSISLYVRNVQSQHQGSTVSGPQFRRLNSVAAHRLILWELFGPGCHSPPPPVVIPSDDFEPTEAQRRLMMSDTNRGKTKGSVNAPYVSALLKGGRIPGDYSVHEGGASAFAPTEWQGLHALLDQFARGDQPIEHPKGVFRQPSQYRHPLRQIHQRLADEHFDGSTVEQIMQRIQGDSV